MTRFGTGTYTVPNGGNKAKAAEALKNDLAGVTGFTVEYVILMSSLT